MQDRISRHENFQSYKEEDDLEVVRLSDGDDESRARRGYKRFNEGGTRSSGGGGGGGTMRADQEVRPASERLAPTRRERSRSPVKREARYPRGRDESWEREDTVYSRLGPRSRSS